MRLKLQLVIILSMLLQLMIITWIMLGAPAVATLYSQANNLDVDNDQQQSSATRTGTARVVLMELFTATWCYYCPNADAAADQVADEYGLDEVALLQYHVWDDGLDTTITNSRADAYGVSGVPHMFFDAVEEVLGGGSVADLKAAYSAKVNTRLAVLSPLTITTSGSISETSATITATIAAVDTITATNLYARFVIYENAVIYGGETYNYVVRNMLEASIDPANLPVEITKTFTLNTNWDHTNIGGVVFVQVGSSGEVLQAANEDFSGAPVNTMPSITLTSPTGGEIWSGVKDITWTATDNEDPANALAIAIKYSNNGGSTWINLATDEPNDGVFSWDTTTVDDGTNYKVKVVVTDTGGLVAEDYSTTVFTIDNIPDNTAPSIELTAPLGGEVWFGTQTITWTATDNEDADATLKITIQYGYGTSPTSWTNIALNEANDGSYDWDTTTVTDGTNYRLKVIVTDSGMLTAQDTSGIFEINNAENLDTDGDGYPDCADAFPDDPYEWLDSDSDGLGNNADDDDDNDGYLDDEEGLAGSNPLDPSSMPDFDEDGIDDDNDPDDDNDSYDDELELEIGTNPLDATDYPTVRIDVILECPCNLLITDEDNNRLGYDYNEDSTFYDEILGGMLVSDDGEREVYVIYNPSQMYQYTVFGTDDGIYMLTIEYADSTSTYKVEAINISTSVGSKNRYTIYWDKIKAGAMYAEEAIAIDVDNDADNIFELTVITGSPVTMDKLTDTDADGTPDAMDDDDDNDGYSDDIELTEGTDPADATAIPEDCDGDFIPDSTDHDIDGDGIANEDDAFPYDETKWSAEPTGDYDDSEGDLLPVTQPDESTVEETDSESKPERRDAEKKGAMDTSYVIALVIAIIIFAVVIFTIIFVRKKRRGRHLGMMETPIGYLPTTATTTTAATADEAGPQTSWQQQYPYSYPYPYLSQNLQYPAMPSSATSYQSSVQTSQMLSSTAATYPYLPPSSSQVYLEGSYEYPYESQPYRGYQHQQQYYGQ